MRTLITEKWLPQNPRNAQNLLAEKYLPQIGTDAHRLGGYGILPYPHCLRNPVVSARLYRLSEQELHQQNKQGYRPQNARNTQNLLAEKYLPQIGTDAHRLGGYGILPYPRCLRNPVYTYVGEQTQPSHLCKSVKSVGGLMQPNFCANLWEDRRNKTSVNSVNSVGELTQQNFCEFREFRGSTDAIKLL